MAWSFSIQVYMRISQNGFEKSRHRKPKWWLISSFNQKSLYWITYAQNLQWAWLVSPSAQFKLRLVPIKQLTEQLYRSVELHSYLRQSRTGCKLVRPNPATSRSQTNLAPFQDGLLWFCLISRAPDPHYANGDYSSANIHDLARENCAWMCTYANAVIRCGFQQCLWRTIYAPFSPNASFYRNVVDDYLRNEDENGRGSVFFSEKI